MLRSIKKYKEYITKEIFNEWRKINDEDIKKKIERIKNNEK